MIDDFRVAFFLNPVVGLLSSDQTLPWTLRTGWSFFHPVMPDDQLRRLHFIRLVLLYPSFELANYSVLSRLLEGVDNGKAMLG